MSPRPCPGPGALRNLGAEGVVFSLRVKRSCAEASPASSLEKRRRRASCAVAGMLVLGRIDHGELGGDSWGINWMIMVINGD